MLSRRVSVSVICFCIVIDVGGLFNDQHHRKVSIIKTLTQQQVSHLHKYLLAHPQIWAIIDFKNQTMKLDNRQQRINVTPEQPHTNLGRIMTTGARKSTAYTADQCRPQICLLKVSVPKAMPKWYNQLSLKRMSDIV
uniref:Uncharacterized protein n=1 Tax=Romanomermis culicivorax TaxID=13658 RepID=A0A915KD42_ROMCU